MTDETRAQLLLEQSGYLVVSPDHVAGLRECMAHGDTAASEVLGFVRELLDPHTGSRED